jgi:Rad51
METNHPARDTRTTKASTSLVHVVKPDIIVFSGLEELDRLLGGFKAGELTLVDGNSSHISDLPNQLCVNTYKMFRSETIYIDGGMCANPYWIARYARILELDQQDVLENVVVSRAFTVYQLSTLIQEMLEPMIQKRSPRTLIIGMLPALYLDPEISPREAQVLLSQDLQKIQALTTRYNLITVCTNLDVMPLTPSKGLGKTLYDSVNEIVRVKQFEHCTSLELVKQGKSATIVHGATGQLRLEAFGMVN